MIRIFGLHFKATILMIAWLLGASLIFASGTAIAYQEGDYVYTVSGGLATITDYTGEGGAITIPSTLGGYPVVAIGDWSFSSTPVTSVIIPSSVTTIGKYAFYFADITSITIPNSVTTIGDSAFAGSDLVTITIPSSVISIGDTAFHVCTSMTSIEVDSANPNYASTLGLLCTKDMRTIIQCPSGKIGSLNIPSSVTVIGEWSFSSSSLSFITVPSSVTTIGKYAFYFADITQILFNGNAPICGDSWIESHDSNLIIYFLNGATGFTTPTWYGVNTVELSTPSSPQNIQRTIGDSQVSLAWSAPASNGGAAIDYYIVYRNGNDIAHPTLSSYVDNGLINGVNYSYYVRAHNIAGLGAQSDTIIATPATVAGPPTNLQAISSNTFINLTWHAPSDDGGSAITNYKVYRGTASGSGTLLTTLDNVLMYSDTGLTNGQIYYYTVSAVNMVGEGGRSSEVNAKPVGPPTAPQSLEGRSGDAFISLSWQAPPSDGGSPITNYQVMKGTTSGTETFLANVGLVLWYNNTGLTNGQTYYYKVRAVNALGIGPNSSEASATPSQTVSIPSPPQSLSVNAGNAQVLLTWSAPTNDGGASVTNYKIYRGTTSGGETLLTTIGNILTYTDTGLTNGQINYYKVSAVNSIGESIHSNEASATPLTVPAVPVFTSVTPGNAHVILTWIAPSSDGGASIISYKLYRGTTSGGETLLITLGNVLTYTNTDLTNDQIYYYKISAVNAVGEGSQSNEVSATPSEAITVPSAPLSLTATAGDVKVVLAWSAPGNDGGSAITNFKVYRGTNTGGEILLTVLNNILTFTDTSISNGHTYFYKVTAVNSVGESPQSDEASATLPSTTPSAPQNLIAIPGEGEVILTWQAPADDGGSDITGYDVYRTQSGESPILLNTVGADVLTYVDSTGAPGTIYSYQVVATNANGAGIESTPINAASQENGRTNDTLLYLGIRAVANIAGPAFLLMRKKK